MKIQTLKINYHAPSKAIFAYVPTKPGVKIEVSRNVTGETIIAAVDMLRDLGMSIVVADKKTMQEFEILVRKTSRFHNFKANLKNIFKRTPAPVPVGAPVPLKTVEGKKK